MCPGVEIAGSIFAAAPIGDSIKAHSQSRDIMLTQNFGIGGVAAGNGWHHNSDAQIQETLEAAWNAGVRYYDTSPFYGHGLSERRFGHFLFSKNRDEFTLSTKVGRLFEADRSYKQAPGSLWHGNLNFKYKFDYTAAGVRRSVEDSLQRLGLSSIDTVFVHDLSPDTGNIGDWEEQFEVARKGAFPKLSKMREEGLIKHWGLGVNTPQPILKALEVADPDMMLVAIQYTLLEHEHALNILFPAMQKKNVKAVIGGPLNGGFLAGKERFNYGNTIPPEMSKKRADISAIAKKHGTDLRTAALQFTAAHPVVASTIPGASTAEQAKANAESMLVKIPASFWQELKQAGLIAAAAPEPKI